MLERRERGGINWVVIARRSRWPMISKVVGTAQHGTLCWSGLLSNVYELQACNWLCSTFDMYGIHYV